MTRVSPMLHRSTFNGINDDEKKKADDNVNDNLAIRRIMSITMVIKKIRPMTIWQSERQSQ